MFANLQQMQEWVGGAIDQEQKVLNNLFLHIIYKHSLLVYQYGCLFRQEQTLVGSLRSQLIHTVMFPILSILFFYLLLNICKDCVLMILLPEVIRRDCDNTHLNNKHRAPYRTYILNNLDEALLNIKICKVGLEWGSPGTSLSLKCIWWFLFQKAKLSGSV